MPLKKKLYCRTTGCRMAYVIKEMLRILRNRFAEESIELTVEQYFILNILDNEDGMILQELAKIVEKDKSAVLRHVDGLEKNHFIIRVQDAEDRRRKLLLVTKRGMKVLEKAREVDHRLDEDIARRIDVEPFEDALSVMHEYLISLND